MQSIAQRLIAAIRKRPAESSTALVAAIAAVVAPFIGLDTDAGIAALTVVIGALPGAITAAVVKGSKPSA